MKDRLSIGYIIENAEEIWRNIANTTSTRGTLLHSTKLPKWKWLVTLYLFSINKSISVRELAKTIDVNKNSSYLMLQKIRYNLSQEDIKLIGDLYFIDVYVEIKEENNGNNETHTHKQSLGTQKIDKYTGELISE